VEKTSFAEYFLEQGFLELLALTAGIAAGYLVLVSIGAAAVAGVSSHWSGAGAFVLASAVTLALFVVLFTLYEAAALYLRYDPHGTGASRQGADREDFVILAKAGFVLLYTIIPLVGAATGYAVARRLRSARPGKAAVAVSLAVAAFLTLISRWQSSRTLATSASRSYSNPGVEI
jgi:hypothetical protein